MYFGVTTVSKSFQRYINKIFAEKFDIFDIVYLDDIFIYTDDNGMAKLQPDGRFYNN